MSHVGKLRSARSGVSHVRSVLQAPSERPNVVTAQPIAISLFERSHDPRSHLSAQQQPIAVTTLRELEGTPDRCRDAPQPAPHRSEKRAANTCPEGVNQRARYQLHSARFQVIRWSLCVDS